MAGAAGLICYNRGAARRPLKESDAPARAWDVAGGDQLFDAISVAHPRKAPAK